MSALGLAFAHPDWLLPALVAVAAAAAALAAGAVRARRRLHALLGAQAPPPRRAPDLALGAAVLAIAVALLGPRLGERREEVPAAGVDLVVVLDVSQSMETRDVPPSRLDRARRAAEEVLARLAGGDRAALAAFAGRGVLLSPLTPDVDALVEMLPAIDTDLMQPRGSRLGEGVRAALAAFAPGEERPRVLLLLSDGEAPVAAGEDEGALAEAARAGVRVLAVSFGTPTGATVPDGSVPLRDAAGRVVISRPDPRRLAALVGTTGGELFASDAWGAIDADAVARAVRRDAPAAPGATRERRVPAVRVAPFAALAFLALAAELGAPWRRRRGARSADAAGAHAPAGGAGAPRPPATPPPRTRTLRPAATGLLALVAAAWPAVAATPEGDDGPPAAPPVPEVESALRARPGDPALLFQLGVARAGAGDHEGAARAFAAAALGARDPALAAVAYYDLGVTALARGELEEARDAFFDALALAPRDLRTRFNLEWTLRALAAQPPEQEGAEADGDASEQDEQAAGGEAARPNGGEGDEGGGEGQDDMAQAPSQPGENAEGGPRDGREEAGAGEGAPRPGAEGASQQAQAGGAAAGGSAPPAPQLTPEEAARWLDGVADDPGRAARQLARRATAGGRPAPAGTPTW